MLSQFRRLSKSAIGTGIVAIVGLLILIGFAMGDIQGLSLGNGGLGSTTLAKVGSFEVTDRDMSDAMQRRLAQVRQQTPGADYSALAADFEPILQSLIDARALEAFALKNGLVLSKRLVDAEIANLPGVKGLNGQVSTEAYQAFLTRERMTDAEVRQVVSAGLLQRLLLTPAATNARVPIGVATPYASMLLEERQAQVALIPLEPFAAGLNPSEPQIQQFYQQYRTRYMIPEQRVLRLARIGPEQVAGLSATDQEIAAYYNGHQELYGAKDIRTISQAVVQDRKVADQIAQRARAGQSFAEAAKPAGLGAQDVTLGEQTRTQFSDVAGDKVAQAAFDAASGAIVGPVQSDLGWHVVKVESIKRQAGKSLAQARSEIAAQISKDKRTNALADMVDKVQDAIDGGNNFDEAAKAANLPITTTPAVTAAGVSRTNPSFKLAQELAPALKSGFELAPSDEPVIEQLAGDAGFVLVAPAEVTPAAPAPLASIRDQVRKDWISKQASDRARSAATAIAAKASGAMSLADAAKQAGRPLPAVQPVKIRRIQLSQMGQQVPAPLQLIFSTAPGKAKLGADARGRGFFVVKVDKIVPGNALNQPGLISQVQAEFADPLAQEYAQEFLNAAKKTVGVRRNEPVIASARKRIVAGGS